RISRALSSLRSPTCSASFRASPKATTPARRADRRLAPLGRSANLKRCWLAVTTGARLRDPVGGDRRARGVPQPARRARAGGDRGRALHFLCADAGLGAVQPGPRTRPP